jgi:uncharacterized phage protein (TIGR01671 family)
MNEIIFKAVINLEDEIFITPELNWIDFINKTCSWTAYIEETGEYEEYEYRYDRLLRYIGLKDKDNKKIFEGDILTYNKYYPILLVSYDEKELKFKIEAYEKDKAFDELRIAGVITKCKKIGNIYQNPELLQDEINKKKKRRIKRRIKWKSFGEQQMGNIFLFQN